MAPLSEAKEVRFLKNLGESIKVYQGDIDPEWNIVNVPFGGYTMAIIVNAAMKAQSSTAHPDPVHITTEFLRATVVAPLEVHVEIVRIGKQFTNLIARLYQDNQLKNMSTLIFGDLTPTSQELTYPLSHTPLCPLVNPPSKARTAEARWADRFTKRYHRVLDPHYDEWNDSINQHGRNEEGIKTGEWVELIDSEPVTADMVPFFIDLSSSPTATLPEKLRNGTDRWWYPTLTLEIEFRAKFPVAAPFSSNTFGIFGRKRYMQNGRHSETVELWTSPTSVGSKAEPENGWREKMTCVASGGQLGLIVHPSLNDRHAKSTSKL